METLQRTANRGSISTGYDIDNSLKLEPANGERLYFTPASAGNRKTWTVSLWFKRTDSGYSMMFGTADTYVYLDTNGGGMHIRLDQSGLGGSTYLYTAPQFRDTSAWYHFVMAVDTTQSTASDRAKFYVNGVRVTSFTTETYPTQNIDTDWNFTNAHYIGGWTGAAYDSAGYMAEVHSVDGQQLLPTDFGEFDEDTGVWKPIEYTGTYGTNGFYLEFKNAADLGDDTSGNNKNFVLSNITSADQATDTPTNNFNIFLSNGHLFNLSAGDNADIQEGGTQVKHQYATGWSTAFTQISVANGKWYAEFEANNITSKPNVMFGVIPTYMTAATTNWYIGGAADDSKGVGFYCSDKKVYYQNAVTGSAQTVNNGDIIGVALDMDNGKAHFSVNNTWINSSNPETNANGYALLSGEEYMFAVSVYNPDALFPCNFGGYTADTISSAASDANGYGTFEYAPPSGYYALCSKNLAEFG